MNLCPRHTQRPRRVQYVLEVLINVAETFLNLKINLAFPVHTTTKLSFHHVYHVRCRLLLRAGSSSKYVHHVFATSSIRPYNSHYNISTFPQTSRNLLRSCQSFGQTDMKILSDRKIFCRSEKKAPQSCA